MGKMISVYHDDKGLLINLNLPLLNSNLKSIRELTREAHPSSRSSYHLW